MGLILKYIRRTAAGTWHYRRRLPKDVSDAVGKGEFKRLLGATEREAVKNYLNANAEFERLVGEARSRAARVRQGMTPLDVHREAERRARELAQGVVFVGGRSVPAGDTGGGPNDISAADLLRDSYLADFRIDPETGDPVGVDEVEVRALNLLASGGAVARPAPTIEDARRLYVQERITGDTNEETKLARMARMMDHLSGGDVGKDRTLESLTREDARNVRDHLLRDLGIRPTTVRRYLNDIRAVINHGLVEFDMKDKLNPFLNLQIRNEAAAVDERHPINDKLLGPIRERIRDRAAPDLWRIWRIVEHTGCRLGEVSGLLVADLRLDEPHPHINLVPHPHRRLKNAGSARLVPLVGEALEAAQDARKAAGEGALLFPRYGRTRGSDAASAILMKHIRAVTDDPKIVVHSLRHRMEDKLALAGVNEFDRNLVLGHSHGGMNERYGSAQVRLEVAARALEAALRQSKGAPNKAA